MLVALCPHCEGKIELNADASGKFECPHCGREFEWNIRDDDSPIADSGSRKFASMYAWLLNKASLAFTPLPLMWGLVLLPISLLVGFVMIILGEYIRHYDYSNSLTCFPHCYIVWTFWISNNSLSNSKAHPSIDRPLPGLCMVDNLSLCI